MDEIAALLKDEAVQGFLEESEKPVRTREGPHVSESKRSVRKKLKIEGLRNEEFLEQVDVVRSAGGDKLEMISDLFQLVESWRYSTTEGCGSAGPLSYFSRLQTKWALKSGGSFLFHGLFPEKSSSS
jgi:hypothetical protein